MIHTPDRRGFIALNSILRYIGVCVIPMTEIVFMENEAADGYRYMNQPDLSSRDMGYFNGLADHASKTVDRFQYLYLRKARGESC